MNFENPNIDSNENEKAPLTAEQIAAEKAKAIELLNLQGKYDGSISQEDGFEIVDGVTYIKGEKKTEAPEAPLKRKVEDVGPAFGGTHEISAKDLDAIGLDEELKRKKAA